MREPLTLEVVVVLVMMLVLVVTAAVAAAAACWEVRVDAGTEDLYTAMTVSEASTASSNCHSRRAPASSGLARPPCCLAPPPCCLLPPPFCTDSPLAPPVLPLVVFVGVAEDSCLIAFRNKENVKKGEADKSVYINLQSHKQCNTKHSF